MYPFPWHWCLVVACAKLSRSTWASTLLGRGRGLKQQSRCAPYLARWCTLTHARNLHLSLCLQRLSSRPTCPEAVAFELQTALHTTTTAAQTLESVDGIWSYKEQVIASSRLKSPISIALYRIGLCYGGDVLWNGGGRAVAA